MRFQSSIMAGGRSMLRDKLLSQADLSLQNFEQTWPADLACRLGLQTWSAHMACRLGPQTWPIGISYQIRDMTRVESIRECVAHNSAAPQYPLKFAVNVIHYG